MATEQVKEPPQDQFSMRQTGSNAYNSSVGLSGGSGHPTLANEDADRIKLTAQFVARNGQKFLQGLTERESCNPAFDFLKPTHGLFGYFSILVEQYSRLLMPRNELLQRYQVFADDRLEILRAGGERHLYAVQEEQKQRQSKPQESTKDEDMDIDWHDFVIVEQIDLYEDQDMVVSVDAGL